MTKILKIHRKVKMIATKFHSYCLCLKKFVFKNDCFYVVTDKLLENTKAHFLDKTFQKTCFNVDKTVSNLEDDFLGNTLIKRNLAAAGHIYWISIDGDVVL